jgi:hypothetical protein
MCGIAALRRMRFGCPTPSAAAPSPVHVLRCDLQVGGHVSPAVAHALDVMNFKPVAFCRLSLGSAWPGPDFCTDQVRTLFELRVIARSVLPCAKLQVPSVWACLFVPSRGKRGCSPGRLQARLQVQNL